MFCPSKLKNVCFLYKKAHFVKHFCLYNINTVSSKNEEKINCLYKFLIFNLNSQDLHSQIHKLNPFNICTQNRNHCSQAPSRNVGRHLYHEETEKAINEQILIEFNAMYMYLSMASHFGRTDVALPGCYGFFMNMHTEEHEHALIFLNFQNMRGGKVVLGSIQLPKEKTCVNGIESAFTTAVQMEKTVKEKLLALNCIAEKHKDLGTIDLITSYFIPEQDRSISQMAHLLARITKMGNTGISEYLFDKEIHRAFVKKAPKPYIPDYPDGQKDSDNKKGVYI